MLVEDNERRRTWWRRQKSYYLELGKLAMIMKTELSNYGNTKDKQVDGVTLCQWEEPVDKAKKVSDWEVWVRRRVEKMRDEIVGTVIKEGGNASGRLTRKRL